MLSHGFLMVSYGFLWFPIVSKIPPAVKVPEVPMVSKTLKVLKVLKDSKGSKVQRFKNSPLGTPWGLRN